MGVEVSIITVGMNHRNYLTTLLKSLYDHSLRPKVSFEMIYIDNCSSDGSVDYIKEYYPQVIVVTNREILGFGENNNKGVALSSGEYVAIINPDIELQKNALDNLYEFYRKQDYECILIPKLLNSDQTVQFSVRKFMSIKIFLMRLLSLGSDNTNNKVISEYLCRSLDNTKIQYVDWGIGAALFTTKDVYNKLNGFDTDYFLYVEDEDLCLRSWKMNVPVIFYPKSKMVHNHLRASKKFNKKSFMHLKSRILFFKKHGLFVKSFTASNHLRLLL
ncbi:glycosyltransferase family 2 protein [Weeksellaceae bacterium A-14]